VTRLVRAFSTLALLFLALPSPTAGPPTDKAETFAAIDRHALDAPKEAEASLPGLAKYLARPCKTDKELARAIYRWITDRITYDIEGFLANRRGDNSPAGVLARRKCVCEGYANLFADLAGRNGLEARVVTGWLKLPGNSGAHSWNAVKIDGKWRLLDATLGAGFINGKTYEKWSPEYYFLAPAEGLIFSHFPRDPRWQLLDRPVALNAFKAQPFVSAILFELGVAPKDLRAAAGEKGFREFVVGLKHDGPRTRAARIPLSRHLRAGVEYTFEFTSEDYAMMAVSNDGKVTPVEKADGVFRFTVAPRKGKLVVGGAPPRQMRFSIILEYIVEE
jgi:hypothetical protein